MIDGAMQHIGTRSPHISPMVRLNLATEGARQQGRSPQWHVLHGNRKMLLTAHLLRRVSAGGRESSPHRSMSR